MTVVDLERQRVRRIVSLACPDAETYNRTEVRRARVPHKCSRFGCDHEIVPGEFYARIVFTYPWEHEADVDDDGRPMQGAKFGEWSTAKYHVECFEEIYGRNDQ